MIQYIFYTLCGTYYCTFIVMITYDLCREYREERESRMNEYRQLQRREPSVELNMINERDYNIQRHVRLTPISEEGENFNV
jgi:hypothetical protein